LLATLAASKSTVDTGKTATKKMVAKKEGPSEEELARIRNAIRNAQSLEEITELEKMLQGGGVPER
jgi:hypothetical protein